jgi:hypothetical protein
MHGHEKSDPAAVVMKPANKDRQPSAELVSEGRGPRGTWISETRTGRRTGSA